MNQVVVPTQVLYLLISGWTVTACLDTFRDIQPWTRARDPYVYLLGTWNRADASTLQWIPVPDTQSPWYIGWSASALVQLSFLEGDTGILALAFQIQDSLTGTPLTQVPEVIWLMFRFRWIDLSTDQPVFQIEFVNPPHTWNSPPVGVEILACGTLENGTLNRMYTLCSSRFQYYYSGPLTLRFQITGLDRSLAHSPGQGILILTDLSQNTRVRMVLGEP